MTQSHCRSGALDPGERYKPLRIAENDKMDGRVLPHMSAQRTSARDTRLHEWAELTGDELPDTVLEDEEDSPWRE